MTFGPIFGPFFSPFFGCKKAIESPPVSGPHCTLLQGRREDRRPEAEVGRAEERRQRERLRLHGRLAGELLLAHLRKCCFVIGLYFLL